MAIIAWLFLGVAISFVTTRLLGQHGHDRLRGMGFGILGAVIGGWVFTHFTVAGARNVEVSSMIIAGNSAVLLLMIYRAVTMRA